MITLTKVALGGLVAAVAFFAEHRQGMHESYGSGMDGMMHRMMDGMVQRLPDDRESRMPMMPQ